MKRALGSILFLGMILALGLCARQWAVSTVRIAGTSMEDTLVSGDIALVWRLGAALGHSPSHGDVVQCRFSGRDGSYVKRVIGLPGDEIEFSQGALIRNGRPVSEPYVSSPTDAFAHTVGEGEILVLGDNRAESYDSRAADMGCISEDDWLGKAVWILWPPSRFGPVE